MKTVKSIFDEHIYLNRKEISTLKWSTLYLTDIPITDYIIFRDFGDDVQFLYLYSGTSLKMSQEYIKVFFNFQSSRFEEIIDISPNPESNLEKFIKGMSQVSRVISRKVCNDDPLELLEQIKCLCEIGTSEFRETYSDILQLEFNPWKLRSLMTEKEI
jgi:hypothetical protein